MPVIVCPLKHNATTGSYPPSYITNVQQHTSTVELSAVQWKENSTHSSRAIAQRDERRKGRRSELLFSSRLNICLQLINKAGLKVEKSLKLKTEL